MVSVRPSEKKQDRDLRQTATRQTWWRAWQQGGDSTPWRGGDQAVVVVWWKLGGRGGEVDTRRSWWQSEGSAAVAVGSRMPRRSPNEVNGGLTNPL